jgi:hypothetical protein
MASADQRRPRGIRSRVIPVLLLPAFVGCGGAGTPVDGPLSDQARAAVARKKVDVLQGVGGKGRRGVAGPRSR